MTIYDTLMVNASTECAVCSKFSVYSSSNLSHHITQ